jgi:sugar phosphate isomerase/epimerase
VGQLSTGYLPSGGKFLGVPLNYSFSLSHLTLLQCAPPQAVEIASRCGYSFVGLRLFPSGADGIAYPLMTDRAMMRDTLGRMTDTGVGVFDIESVCLDDATSPAFYGPLLEAGAELGARTVLVSAFDTDRARLTDRFAALCEAAAGLGLLCHLEFIPWSAVRTPSEARQIVEESNQPNARVLLDTLHLDRSGGSVKDLVGLSGAMDYFHLCDAPPYQGGGKEELLHTARFARLLPGEGMVDIQPVFQAASANSVIGIEVPSIDLMRKLGAEQLARQALMAAKSTIADLCPRAAS